MTKNRDSSGKFTNQNALIKFSCLLCEKNFSDYKSNKRIFCRRLCQNTWLSRNKNSQWDKIKTLTPSYSSVHKWLYKRLNRKHVCSNCFTPSLWTDWASLSHSFKRDVKDYIELCRSCHTRFDHGKLAL